MTTETYLALAACARRRIECEWACSGAEGGMLMLIAELSFDLGQTWACIPCLADFAAVLGVHKSTVSRALRSVRKKGYLQVLMRRDETLYSICTETRGEMAPAHDDGAQVKAKLVEMNKNRRAGTADADGQQRLPGVLPSEEIEAPARAFEAMIEVEAAPENVPRGTTLPPATRATAGDAEETDAEFHARLERMTRTMEAVRETPQPQPQAPSRQEIHSLDAEMAKLCRGLKGEPLHALERLREEFKSGGKLQEAVFFKWGRPWRTRAINHPRQCLEVASEHKNMRLCTGTTADEPGAWMYRALQELLKPEGADV